MVRRTFFMWYIYIAALLYALHVTFTIYINSTFLSQFFSDHTVEIFYSLGSCITLVGLILSSKLLRRFGNYRLFITTLLIEFLAVLGLAYAQTPWVLGLSFILHTGFPLLIMFGLDIFLEGLIKTEGTTGHIRSNYLTIINTAFVISPLIVGNIVSWVSYRSVYVISSIFIGILFVFAWEQFRKLPAHKPRSVNFTDSLWSFRRRKNLPYIFSINFLLHCFYTIMVIFMPKYLHTSIGFSFEMIGLLFTIMLLPFVIFEAPLGRIFDRINGEKDALIVGFVLMSLSSISMFFVTTPSFLMWALMLFISRIGASFVEIASEYAFFRHVTDKDAGHISIFRLTLPLGYVIGPLVAGVITLFLPVQFLFFGIGLLLILGIPLSYKLSS